MRDLLVLLCLLPAALATRRFIDVESEQPRLCDLPADRGDGDGAYNHYFFNQETGSCEAFTYSGLGGNRNNFRSMIECRSACMCTKGADRERRTGPGCQNKYFYDVSRDRCRKFNARGCNANNNRYSSLAWCNSACVVARCYLGKDRGEGDERITRFFYNTKREQCQRFVYKGEQGNTNNFETREECDRSCYQQIRSIDTETERHPNCNYPMKRGFCRQNLQMFFFNSETGECESFSFGGCLGNPNKFETELECRQKCMPPLPRD